MKVGFTGTQLGMTPSQLSTLRSTIEMLRGEHTIEEFHHGDCIGADSQAHDLFLQLGLPIRIHPGDNPKKRAYCADRSPQGSCTVAEPMDNLQRNIDMVVTVDTILACPRNDTEIIRGSGTWHTIRHARRVTDRVIVILPNGEFSLYYSKGV